MAEKFIHINVAAKIPTLADCVKLKAGKSYSATIIQGDDYDGNSGVNLVFNNFCSEAFTIPSIDWFTDTVDGGNFRAYTDSFIILPNQEKSIPLKFIGTYLSDVTSHVYTLTLNGVSNTFTLTITIPVENNPPIISNFSKLLENRAEYTFLLTDFTSKYSDIDGNHLDGVIISGDTSNFVLQGLPLVSGTEIIPTQISSGYLKYVSPNVNTQSQSTVTWYAKDTLGLTSNPATINISNAPLCTAPTLSDVVVNANGSVTYTWNNNGISYTSGTTLLQISYDGGANYVTIGTVSPTSSPQTATSSLFDLVSNGQNVKFRIINYGGYCTNVISNVLDRVYNKLSSISISDIVYSNENSNACFNIKVENADWVGKYGLYVYLGANTLIGTLTINNTGGLTFIPPSILAREAKPSNISVKDITIPVGTYNVCIDVDGSTSGTEIGSDSYEVNGEFRLIDSNGYDLNPEQVVYVSKIFA